MVAFPELPRKAIRFCFAGLIALTLAACDATGPAGGLGNLINLNRPVPVALLVPSSSTEDAAAAQSLENAARLAVSDLVDVRIDLRVYDTAGTAAGATEAATRALADGAEIILGPLRSSSASAAASVAASRGVNVLAFSNNPTVAGGNVFIMGNTFQTSADRLTRYAVQQGKGDVYVVHAQDLVEELGRDAIQRAVLANGATLSGVGSFALSQEGIIDAVPGISSDIRTANATSVFLTSSTAGALPLITQLIPENGVDLETTQFIGLQRLDSPSSALTLKGLQGAWFATPSPALTAQFAQRYAAAFNAQPHSLAGLAYDGIAAVGALVAQDRPDALSAAALTQGAGFAGVLGPFRFFPNGTNERGLAVAQIQDNTVVVIDPAPRSFGGVGF